MRQEIQDKFLEIIRRVFSNPHLVISPVMTAKDIDGWDSLTHLDLITQLEQGFKIKFTLDEVLSFSNVGEILACIERKIKC
jgi:acyl carrier protein